MGWVRIEGPVRPTDRRRASSRSLQHACVRPMPGGREGACLLSRDTGQRDNGRACSGELGHPTGTNDGGL